MPFGVPAGAEIYLVSCGVDVARRLLRFDHHRVRVDGKLGVLVTYPLMGRQLTGPVDLWIVVHDSASRHPTAPAEAQAIVDALVAVPITSA